ncbi:MAG: hypothetical protein WKF76_08990 [Nocardioidaceae bacterium]
MALIVKVWHRRARQELEILKIFYDAVGATGLPFAVPMIVDVLPLADRWATAEVRLEGQPLWQAPGISPPLDARHVEAIIAVLAALADVRPTPEMAILPVLEGEAAFDANVHRSQPPCRSAWRVERSGTRKLWWRGWPISMRWCPPSSATSGASRACPQLSCTATWCLRTS